MRVFKKHPHFLYLDTPINIILFYHKQTHNIRLFGIHIATTNTPPHTLYNPHTYLDRYIQYRQYVLTQAS